MRNADVFVVKVCIQNCLTHDYLGEHRDWVKSEARAKNFDSSVAAIEFLTQQKLADCDVVLKFDPGEYDLRLSVSENCRRVSE